MSFPVSSRIYLFLLARVAPMFAQSPAVGIKNFYQVDQYVYRGAQPDKQGFDFLSKLGVKTVINLRESDARSRAEERIVAAAGMRYVNVPMSGLNPPTDAEIGKVLWILESDAAGPVFVHCKRGADRTGAVIAAYRIDRDGWDNVRALNEAMTRGMSFSQFPRKAYIRNFHPKTMEASGSESKIPNLPAVLFAPQPANAQ